MHTVLCKHKTVETQELSSYYCKYYVMHDLLRHVEYTN